MMWRTIGEILPSILAEIEARTGADPADVSGQVEFIAERAEGAAPAAVAAFSPAGWLSWMPLAARAPWRRPFAEV